MAGGISQAMKAGPAKLEPFYGPTRGFSFHKEIQPILNKHCASCHNPNGKTKAAKYILTDDLILDKAAKRNWSRAYLTLAGITPVGPECQKLGEGRANKWINWINNSSVATMIPPRAGGSTRSGLFPLLEKVHYKVKLSTEELDKLHAWVDLVIPFCGDYFEANAWSKRELERAKKRLEMRKEAEQTDLDNIQKILESQKARKM